MPFRSFATEMLAQEARGLITRLARVRPFALVEPMLMAAAPLPDAQTAIDLYLMRGRKQLLHQIEDFLHWLDSVEGQEATPEAAQRKFTFLKLRFNAVITQFDTFGVAISQRSENEFGVWLAGLDVVAADALALEPFYVAPPILCYLDKGIGAAIRRARTRLPGGGAGPVALVRISRERMIGSAIASSLVHEVGHQAAALLDLVPVLRSAIKNLEQPGSAWPYWGRWISEIIADFWSIARIGVGSTLGLMGVVSLPRPFVFRVNEDDPHPMPWIRVKLSAAIGAALYPHPQWRRVAQLWESYYPLAALDAATRRTVDLLQDHIPEFVGFLVNFRPPKLGGLTLTVAMQPALRSPARLTALLESWAKQPQLIYAAAPSLAFAVMGQARLNGKLTPEDESVLLAKLLTYWALKTTLDSSTYCAVDRARSRRRISFQRSFKQFSQSF
jgi:hypothetical protein